MCASNTKTWFYIILHCFGQGIQPWLLLSDDFRVKEILLESLMVINMSPTSFEYCAMLVYRLKLSARADPGQVFDGFQLGLCVFTIEE